MNGSHLFVILRTPNNQNTFPLMKQAFSYIFLFLLLLSTAAFAEDPEIVLEPIVSGLDQPVAITHAGDQRLFITLQRGTIMVWDGAQLLPTPFLDIRPSVLCCGEQGLLSIAFHPNYRQNGLAYIAYTNRENVLIIARYHVLADNPNQLDPNSATNILIIPKPFLNHNGGQLQFGPDGYLYISVGDGGSGNDPNNNGQNTTSLLGKILRIDVNGRPPYEIPDTNPHYPAENSRREIFAYGLRNPWRFSFDRETGDIWIGDVGQAEWEEIDFIPAASPGGLNFGWRRMEGTHCNIPSTGCVASLYTSPVIEYHHQVGGCSVTGGYVYRGSRFPRMYGIYFYGDYCTGNIWALQRFDDRVITNKLLFSGELLISTFGEDLAGELYVTDHNIGTVFHVTDARPAAANGRRRAIGTH